MRMRTKVYLGVASVLVVAGAFVGLLSLTSTSAEAMTITDRRDCGYTDPIIDCGAISTEELLSAYDRNDDGRGNNDIQAIFNYYGVTRSVIANTSGIKKGWLDHQTGSITVDGKTIGTNAKSLYRVDVPGKTLSPVSIGGKTYYIGNVAGQYSKGADVFVFYKNGQPYMAIQGSCGNPIPFTPKEQPIYSCDSLTYEKIEQKKYSFTASATAKDGATIVSYTYDFGDGSKKTTTATTVDHEYAKAGTYTIKLSVNFNVNGSGQVITSADCQKTITVEEKPVTPVYSCDMLTPTLITTKDRTYEFALDYTAKDGAEFSKVTYDFGDGSKQTTNATKVQHTFGDSGTYNIVATVYFKVKNGTTTSETTKNCEASVTIPKKDNCPLPGKENYPKNSPECTPCPTNPSVPKDSPECKACPTNPELPYDSDKCVETPPELPKTGIGTFIGGGVGFGSIAAAAYYFVGSRKNLFDALLNR